MTFAMTEPEMESAGRDLPEGTMRCHFDDKGGPYWGISLPDDEHRANCYRYWPEMNGEILEHGEWRRLKQNLTNGADVHDD